jgi:hypothetical protein
LKIKANDREAQQIVAFLHAPPPSTTTTTATKNENKDGTGLDRPALARHRAVHARAIGQRAAYDEETGLTNVTGLITYYLIIIKKVILRNKHYIINNCIIL